MSENNIGTPYPIELVGLLLDETSWQLENNLPSCCPPCRMTYMVPEVASRFTNAKSRGRQAMTPIFFAKG